MSGSLEGPVARLERAVTHYRTLKYKLHWGVDRKRRAVTTKCHRKGLEYRFYVGEIEPLSDDWPFLVSEAFFNLRSCLDHLAFQLHDRRFGGNIPAEIAEHSAFPTHSHAPRDKKTHKPIPTSRWSSIGKLEDRDRAAIERLQPYRLRDPRRAYSHLDELRGVVRDIAYVHNLDKHRQLHVVQAVTQALYLPSFEPFYGFKNHPRFSVPLETGTHIDTWTFRRAPPPEQVEMDFGVLTAVSINPEGELLEILSILAGGILGSAEILNRFSNRFPTATFPDLSWIRLDSESV